MRPIDHTVYPHLVDSIFASADPQALASLRTASREWKRRADTLLSQHVVLSWSNGDLHLHARDYRDANSPAAPSPALGIPLPGRNWARLPPIACHIRVLDVRPGVGYNCAPGSIMHLDNLHTTRHVRPYIGVEALTALRKRIRCNSFDEEPHSEYPRSGLGTKEQWEYAPWPFGLPRCDVFVTHAPLPVLPAPMPVRQGGRIVLALANWNLRFSERDISQISNLLTNRFNYLGDTNLPLQAETFLHRHASWGGEVVLFIQPDPDDLAYSPAFDPNNLHTAARTVEGILAELAAALCHHRGPVDTRFTVVNACQWMDSAETLPDELFEYLNTGLGGNPKRAAEVAAHVRFETLDEYRARVGEEQVRVEMGLDRA